MIEWVENCHFKQNYSKRIKHYFIPLAVWSIDEQTKSWNSYYLSDVLTCSTIKTKQHKGFVSSVPPSLSDSNFFLLVVFVITIAVLMLSRGLIFSQLTLQHRTLRLNRQRASIFTRTENHFQNTLTHSSKQNGAISQRQTNFITECKIIFVCSWIPSLNFSPTSTFFHQFD
jgi:hypothetical protein